MLTLLTRPAALLLLGIADPSFPSRSACPRPLGIVVNRLSNPQFSIYNQKSAIKNPCRLPLVPLRSAERVPSISILSLVLPSPNPEDLGRVPACTLHVPAGCRAGGVVFVFGFLPKPLPKPPQVGGRFSKTPQIWG